jgi:hypothetical protein
MHTVCCHISLAVRQIHHTSSNKQIEDGLPEAIEDSFWNNSPESIELPTISDNTWSPIEPEDFLPNVIQHGVVPLATDYTDITELRVVGTTEQCNFDQHILLSPTILYQDLTQKYSNVLKMCESLQLCKWTSVH